MRFRSPTGTALGTASISASGKLVWRNDVSAVSSTSTTNVTSGIWHELVAHVLTGAAPLSEVWLDGLKIDALTRADTLGTSLLGRIELGDPATARTFDVAFDEVSADPAVLGETTPPTAPTNLTATAVSGTEIALSWTAATDNVGVDRYTVIRDGSPVATVTAPTTTFTDTGLQPATSYTYTVLALDAAGNASPTSNPASATTRDTVPPTAPSGLAATVVSGTRIDLAWSASTDNVAVTGYRVYRNGVQVGVAATTSYSDTSVAPATSYSYTVTAVDAAGNESAASNAAVAGTPDTIAPSAPTGLTATPASPTRVDLAWTAATDNVGVTGYAVFRDGSRIATLGPVTASSDLTGLPATTATYAVRALDAAGNVSDPSATATATTPGTNVLSDGFEAGSLAGWSATGPFSAQQQEVFAGVWAARAAATGSGAFANRTLPSPLSSLYVRARFKVVSLGANAATVLKVRTGSASVLGLFLDSSSRLGSRNDAAAITTQSSALVGPGWHLLLVRAVVGGAASETEVWLDGVRIDALARTDSLGTTAISRVELGDRTTGRTFDIAFDDVVVTSP
jgi:chitodextrinase